MKETIELTRLARTGKASDEDLLMLMKTACMESMAVAEGSNNAREYELIMGFPPESRAQMQAVLEGKVGRTYDELYEQQTRNGEGAP